MNILVASNAIWAHTGYAIAAKNLIRGLEACGHRAANVAMSYGLQGAKISIEGVPVYPMIGRDASCTTWMPNHVRDFEAAAVISICDIWPLPVHYAQMLAGAKWLPWFPVDHKPAPKAVFERAATADVPVVYSQWGTDLLREAGIDTAIHIPIGVDVEIYQPGSRRQAREKLGWPLDAFIAATVAANVESVMPSRKAWAEMAQAFSDFERMTRNAYWYVHTEWTDDIGGIDIPTMARSLGIAERVKYVDRYRYALGLPEDYLATVYQAADVLLACSRSEGFGMPLVEAQACGCPVITTDFGSMSELCVNGIAVPPAQLEWTRLESWIATPDVDAISDALFDVACWSELSRDTRAAEGIEAMRTLYSWGVVTDMWNDLLLDVEKGGPAGGVSTSLTAAQPAFQE